MTTKQAQQFNRMLAALKKIHREYMTPDQIRRHAEGKNHFGLDYDEELGMAYENLQNEAKVASHRIKPIKINDWKEVPLKS